MTKAELVEDVARAAELTKKRCRTSVEIVFESIIESLNQGEKIELRGFGSFRVREPAHDEDETRRRVIRLAFPPSAFPILNRQRAQKLINDTTAATSLPLKASGR